jgi:3-oxoacyl-[acyl-carrier protein] reductase
VPQLKDRVIIVTGGGHGLGRAYCEGIVRDGGKAVIVDVDEAATRRVADELCRQGGETLAMRIDVSSEEQTRGMAEATLERFGRIDGLINNAAVFISVPLAHVSGIEDVTVEEWDRVMAVNVRGVFLCCKAVVPQMRAQGYGKIVNISSTTALQGLANFGPYPTSKAAVIGITRGLARDLGAYNITVNAVAPGGTLSRDEVSEEQLRQAEAGVRGSTASSCAPFGASNAQGTSSVQYSSFARRRAISSAARRSPSMAARTWVSRRLALLRTGEGFSPPHPNHHPLSQTDSYWRPLRKYSGLRF